jgi:hypothetical protein
MMSLSSVGGCAVGPFHPWSEVFRFLLRRPGVALATEQDQALRVRMMHDEDDHQQCQIRHKHNTFLMLKVAASCPVVT